MRPLGLLRSLLLASFLLGPLAAARPARAAWPNTPASPKVIVALSGTQASQSSVPDGNGGFFVAWYDNHLGHIEEYVQHYDAAGNALWTSGGVAVATGNVPRGAPVVAADGTGGVVVCWPEQFPPVGLRVQRVNAAGVPQWTANGVRVATQSEDITSFSMCSDGAGGALFAWEYNFAVSDHDIYVQHVNAAGTLLFGVSGLAATSNASMQERPWVAPDGAGGMWFTWRDNTSSVYDAPVQRVSGGGSYQFPFGGSIVEAFVPGDLQGLTATADGYGGVFLTFSLNAYGDADICTCHVYPDGSADNTTVSLFATGNQLNPICAPDGLGGLYVAWDDFRTDVRCDVYGQHITNIGAVAEGWASDGSPIATGLDIYQDIDAITSDEQGGVIFGWREGTSSVKQLRAARRKPNYSPAAGWSASGNAIMPIAGPNTGLILSATGTGGAFCVWNAGQGSESDVVAQRLDAFGQIGQQEPKIVKVKDVPNDQGGSVRVTWDASPLDQGLHTEVQGYQLWKQVPPSLALAALRSGAARLLAPGDDPAVPPGRRFRATGTSVATVYWEYAGGVPAQQFAGYSLTATTTSDSIGGSNPRTTFMVQAVGNFVAPGPSAPYTWWDSAPDSGYSVDNLPPAIPTAFAGTWSGSGAALHWNANSESDLATYRLYRGGSPSFAPSPANRIASPTQTWYEDAGAAPAYYRLTAVDIHGNESGSVLLQPYGTADAPGGLPREIAFAVTSPNPARGLVAMQVDLPQPSGVVVEVFDAAGRRVSEVARGDYGAGRWPLVWRGVGESGVPAGSGLYYLRMRAAGRSWMHRVALLR